MNVKAENIYTKTQQKILSSALSLIAKNGFKATTTKQIAKDAEINESTLFKNFSNKQKVFIAIQENETNALKHKLESILNKKFTNPEEFIHHTIRYIYDIFIEHSSYITITLRELDNETLNIGENSIFEYITNALSIQLGKINNAESKKYNTAIFMTISSLMIMVVNQANQHVLTDDLQAPVQINDISNFTYQMIKTIQ